MSLWLTSPTSPVICGGLWKWQLRTEKHIAVIFNEHHSVCMPDGFQVRHMQSHNRCFQKIQSEHSLIRGQAESRRHHNRFQNEQRENIISSPYDYSAHFLHVLWLAFLLWSEGNQFFCFIQSIIHLCKRQTWQHRVYSCPSSS